MEFKGVRRHEHHGITVILKPSHERGVFTSEFQGRTHVGTIAVIYGLPPSDAEAIADGQRTVLDQYVQADPDDPGAYHLSEACRGRIEAGDPKLHSFRIHDGTFHEYSPHTPS